MCYLPVPCLNFIVGVGSFISILVSLGLLVLTVYVHVEKKQIISNTAGKIISDYLVGLYLASTVFMVLGICGLYSTIKYRKQKKGCAKCWLVLYGIGIAVFFAVFLAGTIFFFVGPQTIFKNDCTAGSQVELVDQLYALNKNATEKFCQKGCECYVDPAAEGAADFIQFAKQNNLKINQNQTNINITNYQACLPENERKQPNLQLMKALQNLFSCSGWCKDQKVKFNRFSNISSCFTKSCLSTREACYDKFQNFLKVEGRLVGFGCAAATTLCLLNLIAVCCIQCHPSRSSKNNFYDKMYDD